MYDCAVDAPADDCDQSAAGSAAASAMCGMSARAASRVARVAVRSSVSVIVHRLTRITSSRNSASPIRATGLRWKMRLRSSLHSTETGRIERRKSGLAR